MYIPDIVCRISLFKWRPQISRKIYKTKHFRWRLYSLKEDKMVKLMIKLIFEKIYFPRKYEGHEYFVGII